MTVRDRVADALRRTHAEQQGLKPSQLLPFDQLQGYEQTRWHEPADAVLVVVGEYIGDYERAAMELVDACDRATEGAS